MQRFKPTVCGAVVAGVAGLLVFSAPGTAQQVKGAAKGVAKVAPRGAKSVGAGDGLYNGTSVALEGIKLAGWGSGVATEDRQYKTIGDNSIKVETNGFYSGARLEFTTPRDLTDQKNEPYGFLEFVIRFQPGTIKPAAERRGGPNGKVGGPNGFGGPGGYGGSSGSSGYGGSSGSSGYGSSPGGAGFGSSSGSSSSGFPGGFPGGFTGSSGGYTGLPGGYGGPGGEGGGEKPLTPDTKEMRVALICDEGSFVASRFPVLLTPAREEGWFSVAIPFVAFKGLDKVQSAKVKEIRVFGDSKDTFWIGEIRTTTDEEPINVEPLDDLEVSVGEPVEFRASASGGISPLRYSWSFELGGGEDATGPSVVHVFRKASPQVPGSAAELQPYVVTVTVSDISGAKRPVRKQASVIVNP
jgi:hypothetical protein